MVGAEIVGSTIDIDLDFQDIYGNVQPFAAGDSPVTTSVNHFDDVVGLAGWPAVAARYTVTGAANQPVITLLLSMQQARYIPSVSVAVSDAQAATAADLACFTTIVDQLADPDLAFELRTTLDTNSLSPADPTKPPYPLGRAPFAGYAQGAYVYLSALNTMGAVTVGPGDGKLSDIAQAYGVTLAQLLKENQAQNCIALFGDVELNVPVVPTGSVQTVSTTAMPLDSDTIASFAANNQVTVDQLADANGELTLTGEAVVPATMVGTGATQYCIYAARSTDTIQSIATLFNTTVAELQALNPDTPGQSDVWICPQMRGDAFGKNPDLTLDGLAQAFNTDVVTLATSNAALLGLLASGVALPLGTPALTTQPKDTFNSIVNRLALQGTTVSIADVANALKDVTGLISGNAAALPVPPPSPATLTHTITPKFSDKVFQLAVNVVITRDATKVDPDFANSPTVLSVTSPVLPEPDAAGTRSFSGFATTLQAALPGLEVATGAAVTEAEAAGTSTFWCVNFGNAAGPQLEYEFKGADTNYFAIPPLSTSLFGGSVDIQPYASGTGLGPDTQSLTFQGVDLDVWLNTFTQAVDLFLSPAYAVSAFSVMDGSTRAVDKVVEKKRVLAQVLSNKVMPILVEKTTGSLDDAKSAMYEALLAELNAAYTVNALVQIPVDVTAGSSDALSSLRLSGKLTGVGAGGEATLPSAFSFSTAKISLTECTSTATFLFTVKSPADHREAHLNLQYVITEMELPDASMVIGDYEGSSWLQFIGSLETEQIGAVDIPVPLRAYPAPTSIVTQVSRQSVAAPATAVDLLGWDFGFVYQHDAAEQDTPMIAIGFNGEPTSAMAASQSATLTPVFNALAQFIFVYPALRDDLGLLPQLPTITPVTQAAVQAFSQLVQAVADAFTQRAALFAFPLVPETYAYQLQKDQDNGNLTQLIVTSVDVATAIPQPPNGNPENLAIWPTSVFATYPDAKSADGTTTVQLMAGPSSDDAVSFLYPTAPPIPANASVEHRFVFAWPNGVADSGNGAVWPVAGSGLAQPQTIAFTGVNPLSRQSAMAAISVRRNQALIANYTTNNAFVYRTPLTRFSSSAPPMVVASEPIELSGPPTSIAQSLGQFLKDLFTTRNTWNPGDTIDVRLVAGYTYPVAGGPGGTGLDVVVPVILVPGVDFNPITDWDWTNASSFVGQVQSAIAAWEGGVSLPPGGSYTFDLTVYAEGGLLQPLMRAESLRYSLGG